VTSTRQGSFKLFRLFGIDVYLHWLWFLVAYWQISGSQTRYSSIVWSVWEYLALFFIVTMHEFGHSLACRSVGGQANQIVLWPLGGIAFVSPPQRPGAVLWSIAAGPLVNVALVPILLGLLLFGRSQGWPDGDLSDIYMLVRNICYINAGLLIFNMLPIYPLDGGQILRSVLWFFVGRARSLMVATIIGFIGVAALIIIAVWIAMTDSRQAIWVGVMTAFILLNCWSGLMHARMLAKMENTPRREGFACPQCKTAPPRGDFWGCGKCRTRFDTFETGATCPKCGTQFAATSCSECGATRPIAEWMASPGTSANPSNPYSA
jgi:Zn-dependent protease